MFFDEVPIDLAVQAARTASTEPLAEFRSTSVLPYTKDLSEQFHPITAWQSHLFYNMFYANFN